jgi:hypothetical protein
LPLQLIVQRADNVPHGVANMLDDKVRVYKPHSDFLLAKSTLPRLLVEVNSTSTTSGWPEDRIQMLLSGASIVRFANKFLRSFQEDKKFVLVAIFILHNGEAFRYTLFQPKNDQSVCCTFCTNKLMG